ncbi:hypothetical protein LRS10_14700 [Phenylobacterium sp. J426]|uniref:hypothetical protein n=1 Tax=Phenylobacterium sp. J426 TaxID=2898439 RepID=UPI0021508485|nr:hypothetical protein [Phenylobacterium sp. J426]MCR5875322.1 hypothetical protein [Phenylobacterium sp. J426]
MPRWSYALGGLIAWTVHFTGVYAFASLDAQTPVADSGLWRAASVALSLACAGACVGVAVVAARRLQRRGDAAVTLLNQLALLGAAVAVIAIAWQTLAVLIA